MHKIEIIAKLACLFPTIALLFISIYPLFYNFSRATETHCKVPNLLPSVSAAITFNEMTNIFWVICIVVHSPLRFMLAKRLNKSYKKLHSLLNTISDNQKQRLINKMGILISLSYLFNLIELSGLLMLTLFPSNRSFEYHKFGFTLFLIFSILFMSLSCYIERYFFINRIANVYNLKKNLIFFYWICFIISVITYYWHNAYCTPYVYTIFGLFEVSLILCNIVFHTSGYVSIKQEYVLEQKFSQYPTTST